MATKECFPGDRWKTSRHEDRDVWLQRRFNFLAQFNHHAPCGGDHIDWPFYHYYNSPPPRPKCEQFYDPLIRPLVQWMNTQPGIRTLYSCQGNLINSPYVVFVAQDFVTLNAIYEIATRNEEGWYWDDILISVEGCGTFLIQFYDIISLMKFNCKLGVTLADQFIMTDSDRVHTRGLTANVLPWEQFAVWFGHPYTWPGSKEPDNFRQRQLLDLDNPETRQRMGLKPLTMPF